MAEPVIFDDGGSTRIKHARGGPSQGNMDGLMDVTTPAGGVPQSQHPFPQGMGPFTKLKGHFIDRTTGAHTPMTPKNLAPGDVIEITSGILTVRMTIGPGNPAGVILILGASLTDALGNTVLIEPQMEARQAAGKRRYVVTNAPPIDKVTYNGATIFQQGGGTDSIYTVVHVS